LTLFFKYIPRGFIDEKISLGNVKKLHILSTFSKPNPRVLNKVPNFGTLGNLVYLKLYIFYDILPLLQLLLNFINGFLFWL
jgi:hypothetical protein